MSYLHQIPTDVFKYIESFLCPIRHTHDIECSAKSGYEKWVSIPEWNHDSGVDKLHFQDIICIAVQSGNWNIVMMFLKYGYSVKGMIVHTRYNEHLYEAYSHTNWALESVQGNESKFKDSLDLYVQMKFRNWTVPLRMRSS